ncbi:MFS transporter [Thiomonas sp.]|jgi:MFS family permease|uniref:MFS transporter n=1 Tax=Thiomonas sp. TaxID=2047785 RepID=UPI002636B8A3|nr:MFS transporter [Thiomonas sp.]
MNQTTAGGAARPARTPLNTQQIRGFWAAWFGWTLDGMDSIIYALVLVPALTELLPRSGIAATPAHIGLAGSILFALFLVGWGLSFIWGPIADRFGRTRVLAATIFGYALFTGLAAMSQNVWELAVFRLLAGIGIGGEWALAGTFVAESWPEDRRKMGAGFLQTGYYAGFFIAAALNFTVGAHYGWRAMFLCGLFPVVVSIYTMLKVGEPDKWEHAAKPTRRSPLSEIFSAQYRRRTLVNSTLLTVAIIGLWAGAVYEPAAIIQLALKQGMSHLQAVHMASIGTGILSIGTILGCLALPPMAERFGRKNTLSLYFLGMAICIVISFGWAFYVPNGLDVFIATLFFLGFFGGNFAMFSLWLPEQYETRVRATAFAFNTSIGRFLGAAVNFILAAAVGHMGTLGTPVAWTAVAFVAGLLVIPFALETRGEVLPS